MIGASVLAPHSNGVWLAKDGLWRDRECVLNKHIKARIQMIISSQLLNILFLPEFAIFPVNNS